MKVVRSIPELQSLVQERGNRSCGFVPTMGALHAGHRSLLDRARKECDQVVLSIFVNPTQFNQPDDLAKYPRTEVQDLRMAENAGVDLVFIPSDPSELYPDGYRHQMTETEFSKELCGEFRPGHFDGVLTVVMKLLMLIRPSRAYFGEKDYQQFSLIEGMARAFFLPTEIIPCPTLRESDGLAMSSRNLRLTAAERELAPRFYRILKQKISLEKMKQELIEAGFRVDYVRERSSRRYGAVWLRDVRLIDNVEI